MRVPGSSTAWALLLSCLGSCGAALALPPDEVPGVGFADPSTLTWSAVSGSDGYNVYRGTLADLAPGNGGTCHGFAIPGTSFVSVAQPPPGEGYFYLVTAESVADDEGTAGTGSGGTPRAVLGRCTPVMRAHVLDRLGYGGDAWSASEVATLGLPGYIDAQLDPASIDESTNTELQSRLALIDPPLDLYDLIALQVVRAAYARRQLEQQAATFWFNHFNTDWAKVATLYLGAFPDCSTDLPQCDRKYPERAYLEASKGQHDEMQAFRDLAFNGTFRQILEASVKGGAMLIYLDTLVSMAPSANENHSRELLELHTLGVEGGYTQDDVEALARVLTGWTLCKKALGELDDPLADCYEYWEAEPPGEIVDTYYEPWHDCDSKTLFAGTPQEVFIPSTCANSLDGVNDITLALDAIAAHPSTKRFVSTKILQRFVTDTPTPEMVDALVAVWNDPANPNGEGDLREVLRAALTLPEFLDPDRVRSKIKTPLEHFASAIRAIRGTTDGMGYMVVYLSNAQEIPHYNPVPAGFPEVGTKWLDTTNTLTRQNFGLHLAAWDPGEFGSDPISLLLDNGVSTAPGNEVAIVDFLNDHLFAGGLTPADREAAVFYLTTDNFGSPSTYDDYKIRKTVGMMLGFPQFQEQ